MRLVIIFLPAVFAEVTDPAFFRLPHRNSHQHPGTHYLHIECVEGGIERPALRTLWLVVLADALNSELFRYGLVE